MLCCVQATLELLSIGRKFYDTEKQRQEAVLQWFKKNFPGLDIKVPTRSETSTGKEASANDGRVVLELTTGERVVILIVDVKLELHDGSLQACRYYQVCTMCICVCACKRACLRASACSIHWLGRPTVSMSLGTQGGVRSSLILCAILT